MHEPGQPAEHARLHGGYVVIGQIERLQVGQSVHQIRCHGTQVIVAQIELRQAATTTTTTTTADMSANSLIARRESRGIDG